MCTKEPHSLFQAGIWSQDSGLLELCLYGTEANGGSACSPTSAASQDIELPQKWCRKSVQGVLYWASKVHLFFFFLNDQNLQCHQYYPVIFSNFPVVMLLLKSVPVDYFMELVGQSSMLKWDADPRPFERLRFITSIVSLSLKSHGHSSLLELTKSLLKLWLLESALCDVAILSINSNGASGSPDGVCILKWSQSKW